MINIYNNINQINLISRNIFQLIIKYESIKNKRKPLLKDIIRKKIRYNDDNVQIKINNTDWVNYKFIYPLNLEEKKILHNLIEYFDNLTQTFDNVFSNIINYFGLAVFFLPGTDKPIPLFYGDWAINSTDSKDYLGDYPKYYIEHFFDSNSDEGRIDQVASELKHLKYPLQEKLIPDKPVNLSNNILELNHFFFWIKSVIDLQYICGYTIKDSNVLVDNQEGFIDEFEYDNEPPFFLLEHPRGNDLKVSWKSGEDWSSGNFGKQPCMFYSPVYLNHDTFVLVVTFLKECNNTEINEIKNLHHIFSTTIFDSLYNSILRENNQVIFENLQRNFISRSLLDNSSYFLDGNSNFTYHWYELDKDNIKINESQELTCADLRSHIYGDYYKNPQDIFKLILDIERYIFISIKNDIPSTLTLISNRILPKKLPNSLLLKNIESTQRSLNMYDRDHIIHQFQVFLLGTNLINKYYSSFFLSFKDSLNREIPGLSVTDENIKKLIKISWFFTSINHDIGYPIQKIDKVLTQLRNDVCSLPNITKKYIDDLPEINVHFSNVLYDDPRSYIILREIAFKIANLDTSNLDFEDKKQRWWYLLRFLTFKSKRHELMSVLSLGLYFVHESHNTIESFIQSNYGKFVINFILLPIALHHFHIWEEDKKSLPTPTNFSNRNTFLNNNLPKKGKIKINFSDNPIAILLLFCDSFQEEGRPSGDKKGEWADGCTEILNLENETYNLNFHYSESRTNTKVDYEEDLYEKIRKVKKLFSSNAGVGPFHNFNIKMSGDFKNNNDTLDKLEPTNLQNIKTEDLNIILNETI